MERSEIADGYLAALGLARTAPTLASLRDITRRHVASFAFSSVGPRLGDDLPLDAPSLYERIVVHRRGGYCFEQNGLLFEVLEELGYSVTLYLARVIHNQDVHPPLTHRVTVADVDGERLVVDVGFGPLGPPVPVPVSGEPMDSGDRVFQVSQPRSGELHMQTIKDGAPYSLYRFDLARYGQADCEVGHFYSHRHPAATFVNNLVASLILDEEIRSLRNREYRVIRASEDEVTTITDAADLARILDGELGLRVTDEECRRLFAALPTTSD
jgi:N-hydroxyarylamine O-acetyltransferase